MNKVGPVNDEKVVGMTRVVVGGRDEISHSGAMLRFTIPDL